MVLIDRIKFDGLRSRDWLIYKYPGESFVTGSQLIVSEGQAAIFVRGGMVCDTFYAGTHTLSTSNLPILTHLINLPFGGKTPFTAEIYFINITTNLEVTCGTSLVQPQRNQMITCPVCNTVNPMGAKLCNSCGTSLLERLCECGAKILAGAKFCNNCGKKI